MTTAEKDDVNDDGNNDDEANTGNEKALRQAVVSHLPFPIPASLPFEGLRQMEPLTRQQKK